MDMPSTLVQEEPTVLVVDDDSTNVLVLESMLRREGYKTLQAGNGLEAVEIAKQYQPDLILLDIMMPEVDGFQACRILQQESVTTDIPVIFLSALDDVECKVKAFDIGAVDYVGKPFQKAEVMARVRLHLKLSMTKRAAIAAQTDKLKQLQDAQQAILVSPEDLPSAQFGISYSPLHEAGGDFYDVLPISDQIFGYFVADISGHDVGASFTTPAIKVLLAQHATPLYTAVETMKNINGVLSTVMSEGNHITASYARLNRSIGELEIITAGHPPLIFQPQEGPIEILESQGDVLGVFESVCFEPMERSVRPGDRFFMYSDGLIERFYRIQIKRQEGLEQLSQAIEKTRDYPIQEAVNRIYQEILPAEYVLEDDIVLLGVEV